MTFTLGLAVVWMANVFAITDRVVFVEIPAAVSDDILFVFPVHSKNTGRWSNSSHPTGPGYFCVNHLPPAERRKWIAEYEEYERRRKAERLNNRSSLDKLSHR